MENSVQIFTNEQFGTVRAIEKDGEGWLAGKDIALNLGYSDTDQAIREHVDAEDKRFFKPVDLTGLKIPNRGMIFVNESGLYSLILSSKLPQAKEFKRWVTSEVLPSIRKTGSYSITTQSPIFQGNEVKLVGEMAADIQSVFAVKRGIALSQAIDFVSEGRNLKSLTNLKELLPPADHDTGFLNATQLGEKLGGIKARAVNKMLEKKGFQYRENNQWRLTYNGETYGEEMPYSKNGHSGYQIRWNDKVLSVLEI